MTKYDYDEGNSTTCGNKKSPSAQQHEADHSGNKIYIKDTKIEAGKTDSLESVSVVL